MPRSAMSILLDAELSRDRSAIQDRQAVAVAEWRDVTEPGPVRARPSLRDRLEGGPHPGPGRARPADGLPRHRHREPAAALFRARRRAGARRGLTRVGGHAGRPAPPDQVHLTDPSRPTAVR